MTTSVFAAGVRWDLPKVAFRCLCLSVVVTMMTVLLSACTSSGDDEPSADETTTPAPPWSDEVPKGVKVVGKGHGYTGNGPKGELHEALSVVLKNETKKPLVLRVSFAVWNTSDEDPWWQSPEDKPVVVVIMPGQQVGTGETLQGDTELEDDSVSEIQVRVSKFTDDTFAGEPVGPSAVAVESGQPMTAEPTKFGHPNKVTFTVDNPYPEAVESIGMGLVLVGYEERISGGWNYRPGETVDVNKTRYEPGKFPPGKSTHEIKLGALAGSWDLDESSLQIYVWARA